MSSRVCGVSRASEPRKGEPTEGPRTSPPLPIDACGLEHLDVRGRRALGALLGVVAHLRAVGQRLEAAALDRVVMHEQVLAGLIWCDEPVALVVAEPLYGSCCHLAPSGVCALRDAEGARRQQLRKRGALLRSNGCPTRRTRVAPRPPAAQGKRGRRRCRVSRATSATIRTPPDLTRLRRARFLGRSGGLISAQQAQAARIAAEPKFRKVFSARRPSRAA